MFKKLILTATLLCSPALLLAEDRHPIDFIKFRARESYEVLDFKFAGQSQEYRGFTNTINLFYEKPFDYSFGLAFGSIFSGLKADGQALPGLGSEVDFHSGGLELKIFVSGSDRQGLFVRPGLYLQNFRSKGPSGNVMSSSVLFGAGYEFLVWKTVSLAPELAYKNGSGGDFKWSGYTVSLGVHFYRF